MQQDQIVGFSGVLAAPNGGAEWWTQVVDADERGQIGFHVDKDEAVASIERYLVLSAVFRVCCGTSWLISFQCGGSGPS